MGDDLAQVMAEAGSDPASESSGGGSAPVSGDDSASVLGADPDREEGGDDAAARADTQDEPEAQERTEDPPEADAPETVTFVCDRYPNLSVWGRTGKVCQFVDGRVTTSDRKVIAHLDDLAAKAVGPKITTKRRILETGETVTYESADQFGHIRDDPTLNEYGIRRA